MSRRRPDEELQWPTWGLPGAMAAVASYPFHFAAVLLHGLLSGLWEAWHIRQPLAICPRGHEVELWGSWTCGRCNAVFDGHAYGSCPDGHKDHSFQCSCGLTCYNPLSPWRSGF